VGPPNGPEVESIAAVDLRSNDSPHTTAVHVCWRPEKDPEDHPNLGSLAFLVKPDGQEAIIGGGMAGTWGAALTSFGSIQALELAAPGRYIVEIRPAMLSGEGRESRMDVVGDRRLAVLGFYVLR
jgi:hypothetical protein